MGEVALSGSRSAAPTWDTAEPVLPGCWCRRLEGDRLHVSETGWGWAHFAGGYPPPDQGLVQVAAPLLHRTKRTPLL